MMYSDVIAGKTISRGLFVLSKSRVRLICKLMGSSLSLTLDSKFGNAVVGS